jgi:hypothetical protein
MKKNWLNVLSTIGERMLIASSYSALTYGKAILKSIVVSDSTQNLFAIASTCFFGFVALKCQQLRGLQNVLIMITADSFSAGVPLPQEPSGQLVMPAILVYFALSATLMRFGYVVLAHDTASGSTLERIIEWVVLFVGARGLARFQALQQDEILGVLALAYLLFPTDKYITPTQNSAGNFFVQITECLLNRGMVLWMMKKIEAFTGISSIFPHVFFFLIVLMWAPVRTGKFRECTGVFAYMTARKIVQGMQQKLSDSICCVGLLSVLVCMMVNGDESSPLINMVILAIGVLTTSWIEKWVRNWSQHSDWIIIYLVIFAALEIINDRVKAKEKRQQTTTILELSGGIPHHQALLGLPHIEDTSGQH